jgi:hypothetical protein
MAVRVLPADVGSAWLCETGHLEAMIAKLDAQIEAMMAPRQVRRLTRRKGSSARTVIAPLQRGRYV